MGYIGTQEVLNFMGIGILAAFALLVAALLDIIRSTFPEPNAKPLWLAIVLIAPVLGPVLYFTMGRKSGNAPP